MSTDFQNKPITKLMEEIVLSSKIKNQNEVDYRKVEDLILEHKQSLDVIANFIKSNCEQALYFSVIYYYTIKDGETYANEMCDYLHLSPFMKVDVEQQLAPLIKERIIHKRLSESRRKKDLHFFINSHFLDSIAKNEFPEQIVEEMDPFNLIDAVSKHYREFFDDMCTLDDLLFEIELLEVQYPELEVFKIILEYNIQKREKLIFMDIFCNSTGCDKSSDVNYAITKLLRGTRDKSESRNLFKSPESRLFRGRILEFEDDNFHSSQYVRFTNEAIQRIFGQEMRNDGNIDFRYGIVKLIEAESIPEKQLYYNANEKESIGMIKEALGEKKYTSIVERLKESNMPEGMTMLFHGFPGTGKTESVLQLARIAGRDILQVDISQIRDKYVGESEKRLKEVFNIYRRAMLKFPKAPILLFNEADALISKRLNVGSSVDQMMNIMQNILLEELEKFKGIFMATTNLLNNMDTAFDRRFLFKVKFSKPTEKIREKIWQQKLKGISPTICKRLANRFDLSGGQMENISRKVTLKSVIENKKPDSTLLEKWCEEEFIRTNGNADKRIGFSNLI